MFDDLIPVINKLQDIFAVTGGTIGNESQESAASLVLELPQIVVVGSQSSGKSSVLESIVGKDFLPRGTGIVTRRPLVLQLFKQTDPEDQSEYGIFLHKPDVKFTDFEEIRDEIAAETDRSTGKNKGISPTPISLKIFSPNVVNLTLVDLPGITRVPVGDQPVDIEEQIRDMILKYITPKNAVILAVTAANADIATSDALRLARSVDPNGMRTLGVLTKLDIMDKGTDALDVLRGNVIPLRLGYVGVVNRSQADVSARLDMQAARAAETRFFQTHPAYAALGANVGIEHLVRVLAGLLRQHIAAFVPTLRARLTQMRQDATAELTRLGPPPPTDPAHQQVRLLEIITRVSDAFKTGLDADPDAQLGELASGARIHFIFNDVFGVHISNMNPLHGVHDNDIKTLLHNAAGSRPALFIAERAFELLARRQIELLRAPALQCVDLVHEELRRVVLALDVAEMSNHGPLRDAIHSAFKQRLSTCATRAKNLLSNVVDCELAFINIEHPDFAGADEVTSRMLKKSLRAKAEKAEGGKKAAASAPTKTFSGKKKASDNVALRRVPGQIRAGSYQTDKEKFEIDVIKTLLASYFDIVRKRLRDLVPKSVMLFLVQMCQKDMHNVLVRDLYGDAAHVAKLLAVVPEVEARRQEMQNLLKLLDDALVVLSSIRS